MSRLFAPVLLLSVALPLPAAAQSEAGSAGVIPPRGASNQTGQDMITLLAGADRQVKDNCWTLGCVLIVNETSGYDVVGFYLDAAKSGQGTRWSRNQFDQPLWPSKATLRFKTGKPETCNLPVRFVLRHRETRETAEITGTSSFCTAPHQDTLIRIKMLEGRVFVRGDDEPEGDATH